VFCQRSKLAQVLAEVHLQVLLFLNTTCPTEQFNMVLTFPHSYSGGPEFSH